MIGMTRPGSRQHVMHGMGLLVFGVSTIASHEEQEKDLGVFEKGVVIVLLDSRLHLSYQNNPAKEPTIDLRTKLPLRVFPFRFGSSVFPVGPSALDIKNWSRS